MHNRADELKFFFAKISVCYRYLNTYSNSGNIFELAQLTVMNKQWFHKVVQDF